MRWWLRRSRNTSPPPIPHKSCFGSTRCATCEHDEQLTDIDARGFDMRVTDAERIAELEAALRRIEQIAAECKPWRDGYEELWKVMWICREAIKGEG